MILQDRYHLTYCTNIHPGESWDDTFMQLRTHIPIIKKGCAPDASFGIGLRLSNKASIELGFKEKIAEFSNWLSDNDLYVFTLNGFPYGDFHGQRVKDLVHAPDWSTYERLEYTLRLVAQLAYLLPEGVSGGISTSPISYRHWHPTDELKEITFKKAAKNLAMVAEHLYNLESETGKYLHLDLEPEPDGLLENSRDVIDFFREYLLPVATEYLQHRLDKSIDETEEMVFKYITVCYDVCHFALAFEDPEQVIRRFESTGIRIGKIQLSSALKIVFNDENDHLKLKELARFDEPTYLHQVTEKRKGKVRVYQDIPVLLDRNKEFDELRAHFHVPLFMERYGNLESTQDQIIKVLKCLEQKEMLCDHLEIETYTWEVLPREYQLPLDESVIREINWVKDKLKSAYEEDGSY